MLGVALKMYTYGETNLLKDAIESEYNILTKIRHPRVVQMFGRIEKPGKTILILE